MVRMVDPPAVGMDLFAGDVVAVAGGGRDGIEIFECVDRNCLDTVGQSRTDAVAANGVRDRRRCKCEFVVCCGIVRFDDVTEECPSLRPRCRIEGVADSLVVRPKEVPVRFASRIRSDEAIADDWVIWL